MTGIGAIVGAGTINQYLLKRIVANTSVTYLQNNLDAGAGGVGEGFYRTAFTWISDRNGTVAFYTLLSINATKIIDYRIIIDGTTVVDYTEGQQQSAALPLTQSWTDAGPFAVNKGSTVVLSVYLWGGYNGDSINGGGASQFNILGKLV
jgi:hypothetical protein